ncbi:PREDICTED: avidin-like [Sturnus vulgaris]|uniref:avidin-like n=1 Tax=Sturnus vulgaris TaxID=9172 RepID=UPI00071A7E60|nr:PREDICTED: avidin-like [Sturnus vulgaris]
MVQATPFLVVLFLALGAPGLAVKQCILTGQWKNDLGSNMTIKILNVNGDFSGIYHTAVAATTKKILPSPLQGSQHLPNQQNQSTFGFTVHWSFTNTTTVFTGQCFVDDHGKEILKTMWLLRSYVDKIEDDWKATLVGYNVFERLESRVE